MNVVNRLRRMAADFAARRAAAATSVRGAERWHRVACAVAPGLVPSHRALTELLRARDLRWEARDIAQAAAERFPDDPSAWMLLGDAWLGVYRQQEALAAFEQALALEERPDAAQAAGEIHLRSGQFVDAAARFARAYAAGGGPEALRHNAAALFQAGDDMAAEQALALWAAQVPDGAQRLPELRATLRAARRPA